MLSVEQAAALPLDTTSALAQPGLVLEPGFHRILLEDGQLSLTLCVGDPLTLLPRQEMQADTVLAKASAWDRWQLKALARCCQRGAQVLFAGEAAPSEALLKEAGFVATAASDGLHAVYAPHWEVRRQRTASRLANADGSPAPKAPGRCAVIGSGLAGASVAQALARRGWQVDVHETGAQAAAGASGLPVGLVVPHHSVDDSPRSRLSRSGTRLMLAHAQRLLASGQDWQLSGVLERNIAPDGSLTEEVLSDRDGDSADLWHPFAAWIKPEQLVRRWLAHPRIQLLPASYVHRLEPLNTQCGRQWRLRNAQGQELGIADQVVFANAHGCVDLLQRVAGDLPTDFPWLADLQDKLAAMQVLWGTLSIGAMPVESAAFPSHPVNGHGSLVCGVPGEQGPRWYAGSTFRTDATQQADLAGEHAANLAKLTRLLPSAAQALCGQFAQGEVQAFQGNRCVSHDRLPLVGPLTQPSETDSGPTLWLCAGMGARGLSFSALCAELLVAWMGHEPLPVESTLARSLSSTRQRRKRGSATA